LLRFEFAIDNSSGKPTVREAMAFDMASRDKIWVKFEHDIIKGSFKAIAPKYPALKAQGKDFKDCLNSFQLAYDAFIASKNDTEKPPTQ
jgi:hypothetical protein